MVKIHAGRSAMKKFTRHWQIPWGTSRRWCWQSRRKEGWWDNIVLEFLDKRAWSVCLSWGYSSLKKLKSNDNQDDWYFDKGELGKCCGPSILQWGNRKLTSIKSSKTCGRHSLRSSSETPPKLALKSTSSCSNAGYVPGINSGVSPLSVNDHVFS